jgi:hypothetical protein
MGHLRDILSKFTEAPGQRGQIEDVSQVKHAPELAIDGPVTPRDVYRFRRQRGVNLGEWN